MGWLVERVRSPALFNRHRNCRRNLEKRIQAGGELFEGARSGKLSVDWEVASASRLYISCDEGAPRALQRTAERAATHETGELRHHQEPRCRKG